MKAQEAFKFDPQVQVLLATDAAGEGINLQRAHLMVNYDLPWNPNRIEQRFGRIHRIGQTEVCHLWNLVANETREGEVFKKLLDKLEIERALRILSWTHDDLLDTIGSLDPEKMAATYPGERWSINGILNHVAHGEWFYQERVGFPFPEQEDDLPPDPLRALEAACWRVTGEGGAAGLLGMKPTTLSSRMKALGIARPR